MRIDRFTQKMQEALQAAQDIASENQQRELSNEHFLAALIEQAEGVARPLLEKVGVSTSALQGRLADLLSRRAKVQGTGLQVHMGSELRDVLDRAEKEMGKMKDEFVSAEHYLIALIDSKYDAARLLKDSGVTRDRLMQALQQVRGSQ